MSRIAEPRARSIAWPIFALVLASVVAATAVYFAVTFNGPPPMDPPRGIESIADALRTGRQPQDPGPDLAIARRASAPAPRTGERRDRRTEARIAAAMGVPAAGVLAYRGEHRFELREALVGSFTIAARVGDGWRVVRSPPSPVFKRWHYITLSAMLATLLALAGPAWWAARTISRPLRQLAAAAAQARAGAPLPPLPTSGPREVRALAEAVGAMHARLARHAEGRTTMLGAIAHDLGTPLSRIAFWIEQLPEAARLRADADIDEMRAMIAATLAFARDEAGASADTRIDLGSLLDSLVEDLRVTGAAVALEPGPRALVRGDPIALRRLFGNLVENAIRYGERATLGWSVAGGVATVTIDDEGPGVAAADAERLFEPFVRGDPSRNRATGGTGLGLAIARSIAVRHGGGVTLAPRAGRGTRAAVTLPTGG